MTFGEDKCAYQETEKGKLINNTRELQISDLKIKPIPEGDSYKYLGIDENISYVGLVNKTRVKKEYYARVKRIWNSELSSFNKLIAHNSFAVPVLTTTVGILNWTIDEIKEIDIKTRKQLTMSRNFHPNGDIYKFYLPRGQGGRGIKMIVRMFESRIISIAQYIKMSKSENNILDFLYRQEEVAKTVLNSHLKKFCPDKQIILSSDPNIYTKNTHENTGGTFR